MNLEPQKLTGAPRETLSVGAEFTEAKLERMGGLRRPADDPRAPGHERS